MTTSGQSSGHYWCTKHGRVETDADLCPARFTLGPYASPAEAETALSRIQARNEQWDAEDARWSGDA